VVFSLPPLLALGYQERLKNHLTLFLEAYRRKGKVPALIARFRGLAYPLNFLRMLGKPSLLSAYPLRFMLPNLWRLGLQPWTGDSLPLLLIGVYQYARLTGDGSLLEAYRVEIGELTDALASKVEEEGLLPGSGWMDAMANYLGKPTLTCQLLAYEALKLSGKLSQASTLKSLIRENYWNEEGFYTDLPGSTRMDSLANALAAIYGVASNNSFLGEIVRRFSEFKGLPNIYPPYPRRVCGQKPYTYQNAALWPFIQGYLVAALVKAGLREEAAEAFRRLISLPGLNEWYTVEGEPRGSPNQLWTAAQIFHAYRALGGSLQEENLV